MNARFQSALSAIFLAALLLSIAAHLASAHSNHSHGKSSRLDPLASHAGTLPADRAIQAAQARVTNATLPIPALEHLGWSYIAKARESFDYTYYQLAEACADAIDSHSSDSAEALLLRGHVHANLHRFSEAEATARQLVDQRGIPVDHLLLGDALMEQGKLVEAITAYQTGVDLRPDPQSYARVGWIRWLIGDLSGAIEATQRAARASSPQSPEPHAWLLTRLASFQFLANQQIAASTSLDETLITYPDYPPALLLRGRMLLAAAQPADAIPLLRRAAKANPLPEYQWVLIEALQAAGEAAEAKSLTRSLLATGERDDPRTHALFLATTGQSPDLAVTLARRELADRQDIFTHDALAWAFLAAGDIPAARRHMDEALAESTEDGRLFLHAAVIAHRAGEITEARDWFADATDLRHTLLPSERTHLETLGDSLATAEDSPAPVAGTQKTKQPNKS